MEEKQTINFSFDDLKILGVFGKQIHIKGYYFDITNESQECVVIITNTLLKKALDLWIKDKKSYCENWNHYCGQGGRISSQDWEKAEKTINVLKDIVEDNDDFKPVYHDVPAYFMKSFDSMTDMEHG